ncbi:MAG: hypothetical protein ACRD0K_18155, partial [Egibacteraceae bacterium]
RNVIHQAEDVLGYRCKPTVAGVIDALSLYGYDVLEVHVGLALAREMDREALSGSHAENLAYLRTVEAHPRVPRELHRRPDGRVEEKMVDVACAVEVARHATLIRQSRSPFRAIVMLSARPRPHPRLPDGGRRVRGGAPRGSFGAWRGGAGRGSAIGILPLRRQESTLASPTPTGLRPRNVPWLSTP